MLFHFPLGFTMFLGMFSVLCGLLTYPVFLEGDTTWMVFLLVSLVSGYGFFQFSAPARLTFNRQSNTATLINSSLLKRVHTVFELCPESRLEIETRFSMKNRKISRFVLHIEYGQSAGTFPLGTPFREHINKACIPIVNGWPKNA